MSFIAVPPLYRVWEMYQVCMCVYIYYTYIIDKYGEREREQWILHNNVLNIKWMKIQLKNKLASRPTHDFTEVCKKHKSSFSCCLRKSFFSSQHIIGDTEVSMLSMHCLLHYFIPLCLFFPHHTLTSILCPTLMLTANHCICMYYWKIIFYICVLTFCISNDIV